MRKLMAGMLLFSSSALAGEMYGTITDAGKPVAAGVGVGQCGQASYPAVKTDKSGAYHLVVKEKGKCQLTVRYKNQSPAIEVASYDEGVQLDLTLELKDGSYTLRRK
jgi:hypothetical protein